MAIPKGTEIPKTAGAFLKKFDDGTTTIRVLTPFRIGFEGWKNDKPFRHEGQTCYITPDMVDDNKLTGKPNINFFWVALVWNYSLGCIQVMELTQKTIMKALQLLEDNPRWGDLLKYDVDITKTIEGDRTTYQVQGVPPAELDPSIKDALAKTELHKTMDEMFDMEAKAVVPTIDF